MNKTLKVGNQTIDLIYIEGANCWQTKTLVDGIQVEIEIDFLYHKEKEVDWKHFEIFYLFIGKSGMLKRLIVDSEKLVNELGRAFYRDSLNVVADYKMNFNNSIFYNGKTDGTFISNGYSYSLLYYFFQEKEAGILGDQYGLYKVDIENFFIVGTKRLQC